MSLVIKDFSLSIHETKRELFRDFNVEIRHGEIVALMGASGSGKSSLLNFVLGIISDKIYAMSGELFLADKRIEKLPTEKRGIGILFQDALLFPHMNIEENLAFALSAEVKGRAERREHIREALAEAQLDYATLRGRLPHTLSGGEQARVSVLRALLSFPKAILLDEPFSKLDTPLRTAFRKFVFRSIMKRNIPALIVTHDKRDTDAIPEAARGPLLEIKSL